MASTSINIIVFIFLLCLYPQFAFCNEECTPGVKSMGYTVPKGDIAVKYGNPLDIYCILHDEEVMRIGPNASRHLTFQRNSWVLNQEMIQIINNKTIKLHIDKPAKAVQENYMCIFRNETLKKTVCMNFVFVGVPPQPITDFNCISNNLDNLTCRWTAPENFVYTRYDLSFSIDSTYSRYNCPKIEESKSERSCFWNLNTSPIYRQPVPEYNFTLKASNSFGFNEIFVSFDHYKHVRPNPPENLTVLSKTWNSFNLSWTVPSTMQTFRKGLEYRILYQSDYGEKKWHALPPTRMKKNAEKVYFNLSDLEFAHAYYDIRVSLRSAVADKNDESMWSENASLTVLTASKKPDAPPKTNLGGFELLTYGNHGDRNIRIYWSHIPEEKRNGQNFTYVVTLEGGNSKNSTENAYMLVEGLSYKSYIFRVSSKNEMGFSDQYSIIRIPKQEDCVGEPTKLLKQVMKGGTYRLFWQPPQSDVDITNYTIFWCNDEKDLPPCSGTLKWEVVPGNLTFYNKTIPSNKTYQFAISANTNRGSSGMSWVHCTDSYDEYSVGKVREFWRSDFGSDYVVVSWIFGCSGKSVTAFIIYYCPTSTPGQNVTCIEPENNVIVPSNQTSAKIKNLSPYTTYSLQVAAVTKHKTYSQRSERLMSTTMEAEPSTAPTDLTVDEVTNSTIKISWKKPVVTNGMLKYYKITYNESTIKINEALTYTLTNLTSYQTYEIRIRACTVKCSKFSKTLHVQTKIGYPSIIRKPLINQNATFAMISWDKPLESNGRIERYELRIKHRQGYENITSIINTTERMWGIYSCGKENKYTSFYVSVRAVNLDGDKTYYGKWSDEVESYCRSASNYIIYILVPAIILFLLAMTYLFKKIYTHFQEMRDVGVKLPQGLQGEVTETDINLTNWQKPRSEVGDHHTADDEEKLLMNKNDGSPNLNVDSSGCSSAHESVTCSVETASNISSSTSDSGTEQPRTPSTEDLTELAVTTSLRQRNIRPSNVNKPYVALPLDTGNSSGMKKLATKNYCILGVDPNINVDNSSAYTPLPAVCDKPVYGSSESSDSPPYVLTGELVKTANPSYVPFKANLSRESSTKTPTYVIAGSKDLPSPPLPIEPKQPTAQDSAYIKIADNIALKNADINSWQPPTLSKNSNTGYVSIGEVPPMKKESKAYVPHRQLESKTLKED